MKENDRGKFAFVTFDTHEEANKALELNGTELKEKSIMVKLAGPKPQKKQGGNERKPRQQREEMVSEDQPPKLNIVSLAEGVTEEDLRTAFEPHGNIVDIFLKENERGKFAFVTYDTLE